MADFFTRLAERALGTARTALPVVPSVFTPLAPARPVFGDLSAESAGERRAATELPSDVNAGNVPSFVAASESINSPTTPTLPSPAAAATVRPPGDAAPQRLAAPPILPFNLRPSEQPLKVVTREGTQVHPHQAGRSQRPVTPPNDAQNEKSASLRPEPELARAEVPVGDFARPASSSRIVDAFALPANSTARNLTGDHPALFTARGKLPARLTPAREHSSASPAVTRPTVRVTIGRVDVHAIFPERRAPPARFTASPSMLSLDEYLKQRRGGQR